MKRPWAHSPFLCSLVSWWQLAWRGQEVTDPLRPKQLDVSAFSLHNMQIHGKGINSAHHCCQNRYSALRGGFFFFFLADKNGPVVTLSRWQPGPWEASFALLLHNYRYSDLCSTTLRALSGWLVNGVQRGIRLLLSAMGKWTLRHWWVLNAEWEQLVPLVTWFTYKQNLTSHM